MVGMAMTEAGSEEKQGMYIVYLRLIALSLFKR